MNGNVLALGAVGALALGAVARRVATPGEGARNVGSPAFWKWFGNSAVVDDTGAPLVVFHGTSAIFDTFDKKMRGSVSESSDSKVGFFFTSSLQRAEEAARDAAWMTKPEAWSRPAPGAARVMREGVPRVLAARGYDGIRFMDVIDQSNHAAWAIWDSRKFTPG